MPDIINMDIRDLSIITINDKEHRIVWNQFNQDTTDQSKSKLVGSDRMVDGEVV